MLSLILKFHIYFSLAEGDCISSDLLCILSLRCILSWHSLYVVIPNHAHSFSDLLLCFVFVISLWVPSISITWMCHWMSHHCDYFVLNSTCLSSLGRGMLFSSTIHFLMMVGCLHHHTGSESPYYTCYSRLIGCSPSQHPQKVGGDLWWSTTANFKFMVLS